MIINNSLTLELHQLKKNFVRQNEVFHFNSKILNKIIRKGKVYGVKRGLRYLSMSKTLKSRKNTLLNQEKALLLRNHPQSKPLSAPLVINLGK